MLYKEREETFLAMGRVKRGSMAGEPAYLQKTTLLSVFSLADRWLKVRCCHTQGLEMMKGSRQMFVFCYLFRKLAMITFCLDTVRRNVHEASIILRMLERLLLHVQGLFTPYSEDWHGLGISKSV